MYGVTPEFRPFLARGLSYYNGTVVEIWSDELGVSLAGGGAYMVDDVQAFGIALGFEPISLLSKIEGSAVDVLVLSLGCDVEAVDLAERLRGEGIRTVLLMDKAIGKGLEYADSKGIGKVVFVGADEVAKGEFKVRDMGSGVEEMFSQKEILEKNKK